MAQDEQLRVIVGEDASVSGLLQAPRTPRA